MYEQYWRLDATPFSNDSDTKFFYRSETHEAALLKLRYLVEHDKEAGMLVGATGIGKTYLTSVLAQQLPEKFTPFVHVMFPQMSAAELLAYLAVDLGADENAVLGAGLDRIVRQIETLLLQYGRRNQHPVIVIDEAHVIEDQQVFEALRMLLN